MSELECGIVILPPTDLAARIIACQRAVDPAFVPAYPPHITTKALFRCRATDTAVATAIARACRRRSSLEIQFDGLQSFATPAGHILYLAVRPTPALRSLHRALLRALTPLTTPSESVAPGYEGAEYRPHLTLLSGVPGERLAESRAAMAGLSPAEGFVAAEVALICRLPGQAWLAPRPFALGRPTILRTDPANPICSP